METVFACARCLPAISNPSPNHYKLEIYRKDIIEVEVETKKHQPHAPTSSGMHLHIKPVTYNSTYEF